MSPLLHQQTIFSAKITVAYSVRDLPAPGPGFTKKSPVPPPGFTNTLFFSFFLLHLTFSSSRTLRNIRHKTRMRARNGLTFILFYFIIFLNNVKGSLRRISVPTVVGIR